MKRFSPRGMSLDEATEVMSKAALKAALDLETALREVAPIVGEIHANSAEEAYEYALKGAGVDLEDIPPEQYRAMVRLLTPEGKVRTVGAMDAAAAPGFAARFPSAARIVKG